MSKCCYSRNGVIWSNVYDEIDRLYTAWGREYHLLLLAVGPIMWCLLPLWNCSAVPASIAQPAASLPLCQRNRCVYIYLFICKPRPTGWRQTTYRQKNYRPNSNWWTVNGISWNKSNDIWYILHIKLCSNSLRSQDEFKYSVSFSI